MRTRALLTAALVLAGACGPARADAPERRVDALVARLTIAQKLSLLHGGDPGQYAGRVPGIPAVGIPPLALDDGPAGIRDGWSFAYPAPIALGATFDPSLATAYGTALAGDALAKGADGVLGPDVDLARVPANGRGFEGFGEDPWLAGAMGAAEIVAVQRRHVVAVVKHYVAYNQQTGSHVDDVVVDPRAFHELYLAPFAAAVRAGVAGVMCSYNRIGGDYACENRATYDVLERELGFAGFVVSDWYAQHDVYKSIFSGLDLEMPRGIIYGDYLTMAVEHGNVSHATIDRHVRRVLGGMAAAGLLDGSAVTAPPPLDVPGDLALARRIVARGAVLLKNDGAELPLDARSSQSIALVGASDGPALVAGGGSSYVRFLPGSAPSVLDAVRAAAGAATRVIAVDTAPPPFVGDAPSVDPLELRATGGGDDGWTGSYFADPDLSGSPALVRHDRRIWFQWGTAPPLPGLPYASSVRWTATLRVRASGTYEIGPDGSCACRLRVGGTLLSDAWDGKRPEGLAPVELRAGTDYPIAFEWHRGGSDDVRLAWRPPAGAPSPELDAAVAAARRADRAIVLAGDYETEGADRASLRLSPDQERLIAAVSAANPHTTVVLETGGAVVTGPWLAGVRSLVELWYPGEAGGLGLADVLFGRAEPGGRLPVTFPASADAIPAGVTEDRSEPDGPGYREPYAEGLDVGYRWYDARNVAPQFPFGFGLSYGEVAYSGVAVAPDPARGGFVASATVANTGDRATTAIPEWYLSFPASAGEPPRELLGAMPVDLAAGESRRISLPIGADALRVWSDARRGWIPVGGRYAVAVGASSRALAAAAPFDVR